jgi:prepilin-type N-terminal cleavage/methylation domain-containing protein
MVGAGSHAGPQSETASVETRRAGTEARPYSDTIEPRPTRAQSGITLIELLVAMAIIGLMLAITFPSFTSGLDGIVLRSDIDRAGSFFSQARLQADRLQQPVQLTADPQGHKLTAVSVDGSWEESFVLHDRSQIVFPQEKQSVILHPSTPAPQFRLLLESERGARAGLQINVFTAVPEDWNPSKEDAK